MEPQRAQSFSHAPRHPSGDPFQQHPPQQANVNPAGAAVGGPPRPSPFASSGPVAMVNQIRPGGNPGQFPGVAVRTNPTQLSTPLVPARRASTAVTSSSVPMATPPTPLGTANAFAAADQLFPTSQAQYHGSADRYQTTGHIPMFQVQQSTGHAHVDDPFARAERIGGEPPGPTASAHSLFGSASESTPAAGAGPPERSTQSFSYGQTPQQEETIPSGHPPRSISQPPPPAAPFLGYADQQRSQSFRHGSPAPLDARGSGLSPSHAGLARRNSNSGVSLGAAPPRIHAEVRSADDLLEEFMRVSLEDQYLFDAMAQTTFPGYSGNIVPPAKKLTLADIPDTIESLEMLYRQRRWKTLTKKSLSMLQHPTNDQKLTLEIKSWWLAGLIKEGHYDNATSVIDQVGDLDDPEYAKKSSGQDSFVLLRLRLLEALLCKYKGNNGEHEKKLFQLIARLKNAIAQGSETDVVGITPESARKWLRVAQFTLVNHFVQQNKFSLALRVCSAIDTTHVQEFERVIVLSRLGRIHLQMGDLVTTERLFRLARDEADSAVERGAHGCADDTGSMNTRLQGRLLLNDGLLYFAQNQLQEALSAFDSILHLETTQPSQPPSDAEVVDMDELLRTEEDLISVAVNNFAICALYCCDVKGAVAALERMIRSDPARFLNAVVVFNLSSLYDLIFDNPTSTARKEMMKKLAELYDLEHIDPAAFRI